MNGKIFEIQHFALYDGPGIRTVIYLKGCPLRCVWCHNPEGMSTASELMFDGDLCRQCSSCVSVCGSGCHTLIENQHRLNISDCTLCGNCVNACPARAMHIAGTEVTTEEIIRQLDMDKPYYRSQGGLTLSGGEPLFQPEFAYEILLNAHCDGVNTCVETSGFCSQEVITKISAVTDLFLYDIKAVDSSLHKKCTGADNGIILSNLRLLDSLGAKVVLRCPMIEGVNDGNDDIIPIARLANELNCVESLEFEPYHPLGLSKYKSLGKVSTYDNKEFYPYERFASRLALAAANTDKPVKQA